MANIIKRLKFGYTLTELLIVISLLGILAAVLLATLDPFVQLKKARDAKRKTTLVRMKKQLDDYFNDNNKYPVTVTFCQTSDDFSTSAVKTSICDPVNSGSFKFTYVSSGLTDIADQQWYKIYTDFENNKDQASVDIGCTSNCTDGAITYNWGVSSPNVTLGMASGVGACTDVLYACQGQDCNGGIDPSSSLNPKYCGDPCCGGACYGPASCPLHR